MTVYRQRFTVYGKRAKGAEVPYYGNLLMITRRNGNGELRFTVNRKQHKKGGHTLSMVRQEGLSNGVRDQATH